MENFSFAFWLMLRIGLNVLLESVGKETARNSGGTLTEASATLTAGGFFAVVVRVFLHPLAKIRTRTRQTQDLSPPYFYLFLVHEYLVWGDLSHLTSSL